MVNREELLRATLRQPTARLTESEAAARCEELRQRGHFFPHGSKAQGNTPAFQEFRTDWQRMMQREE